MLEQIRGIGQQDGLGAHFPQHSPGGLFPHYDLQSQAAAFIRLRLGIRPTAGDQAGMFLKAGEEKGAAGDAAQQRRGDYRFISQGQIGRSAAETLRIPQDKVQPGLGRFLD